MVTAAGDRARTKHTHGKIVPGTGCIASLFATTRQPGRVALTRPHRVAMCVRAVQDHVVLLSLCVACLLHRVQSCGQSRGSWVRVPLVRVVP